MTDTFGSPSQVTLRDGQASASSLPGQRPLDILIVTSEAPPIVSGISTCIQRLANGLTGRGHHVSVLSSVQIPRLAVGELRLSSFVAYWPRIARELRQFDVVNVHGPVPTMSDAFLRLSDRLPPNARPAIVYTHHSPIDIRGVNRISARYNKLHDLSLCGRTGSWPAVGTMRTSTAVGTDPWSEPFRGGWTCGRHRHPGYGTPQRSCGCCSSGRCVPTKAWRHCWPLPLGNRG